MPVDFPAPNLLGAPERYTQWRNQHQIDAVLQILNRPERFVLIAAPTGFGKSLSYTVASLLSGKRAVTLTSTKALQSQLYGDFAESGLVEIKGQNAYECLEGGPTGRFGDVRREGYRADRGLPMACDEAPCQSGAFCPRREGGCLYYDAHRRAASASSRYVVTNYAYWMSINKYNEDGLGPVDILVLDEAHSALDELGGFIGTELKQSEIESILPTVDGRPALLERGADVLDWVAWSHYWLGRASTELEAIKAAIKESERTGTNRTGERLNYGSLRRARDLRRLIAKLETIAKMDEDWIVDWTEDHHRRTVIKFDPVWPSKFAESTMFLNVPKVVLVSATVRPETADMLGIPRREMSFHEYPSTFPVKNRPIIYLPVGNMNRNNEKQTMPDMSTRIDQIIARREDRKGLIQTVSYQRARAVWMNSKYKDRMLQHDSTNTNEVIAQFKRSTEPLILVSPVLSTGYDFPYDQAEYQILVKMPFPVSTDKILIERVKRNDKYKDLVVAIELVQMAGRIVRAEDDQGETFILDADFGWWYYGTKQGKKLCAQWFQDAVRKETMLGPALPKLRRNT